MTFWQQIAKIVLKNRLGLLICLIIISAFMAYKGLQIEMSYQFARIIPEDNIKALELNEFRSIFGDDGNVLILGFQSDKLFELDVFNDWYRIGKDILKLEGIEEVLSVPLSFDLKKNQANKKFEIVPIVDRPLKTQAEADSIKERFLNLPFYENLIYNPETKVNLMAVTIEKSVLNSRGRIAVVENINALLEEFSAKHNIRIKKSGLPYFRTNQVTTIADEFRMFLFLALGVTLVILYILFRSFYAVFFSMIVVMTGVLWSIGILVLFGYKITLLTGLVPALIVVIGIPNCVYLLNKYHAEFKRHGNKIKALSRVIEKIGHVTFFTNLTTATGFGVFYFTNSKILVEFGAIAGINITLLFLISLIIIPVVFSYLPDPNTKHTGYLDNRWLNWILEKLDHWSHHKRTIVYTGTTLLLLVALGGIVQLKARGYILDDIPPKSAIYQDLKFFEKHFKGVLPFEIVVDTKKKKKATQLSFMKKMEQVQQELAEIPVFSKPLSIIEGSKFATQAFYNGNPERYRLPDNYDKSFIAKYLNGLEQDGKLLEAFVDSNRQKARISIDVADIGSVDMPLLIDSVKQKVEAILDTATYKVTYTGTSIVALAGYSYLINGLINSVSIAFLLIALIMAYLFGSFRMLIISLLPNTIPLILTAGLMGYFDIPLKPSTVLIFSIAFGISVDDTIHFLAKYRQELFRHNWQISKTVSVSLRETGISMIYTTLILFSGFIVFTASSFEGTVNLGFLASIALIVALFTNLLLLPSLLLSFERFVDRKAMKKEPLMDVYDEEEDIELEKLDFRR